MARWLFIISVLALGFLVYKDWDSGTIQHQPGVLVPELPVQIDADQSRFMFNGYQLTRKARFEIRARVLSTEEYFVGREADLSPIDLALGWGQMSNQAVLDQLEISQGGRWFRWRYEGAPPVSEPVIISSSSNMHMIPSSNSIKRQLKRLRSGSVIRLEGYLVDVDHDSGWHWRSSMSRVDTGDGACELVYVESLEVDAS